MRILSFQSQVIFGHVGNSAAAFPLQCMGHEVWAVPTSVLSNHAGYPDIAGRALAVGEIADLVDGLDRRGALAACDLVLSGYLGAPANADAVADAIGRVRAANPDALYCCDPVIGDRDAGIYVDRGVPGRFAERLVPPADLLTPNLFELEVLAGVPDGALAGAPVRDIAAAAREVVARMRPGGCLLVTSVDHGERGEGMAAMLAVDAGGAWLVETPVFAFTIAPHGAGDLVAALFAADFARHREPARALGSSAAILHAVFEHTARDDAAELALVAARAWFAEPPEGCAVRDIA